VGTQGLLRSEVAPNERNLISDKAGLPWTICGEHNRASLVRTTIEKSPLLPAASQSPVSLRRGSYRVNTPGQTGSGNNQSIWKDPTPQLLVNGKVARTKKQLGAQTGPKQGNNVVSGDIRARTMAPRSSGNGKLAGRQRGSQENASETNGIEV